MNYVRQKIAVSHPDDKWEDRITDFSLTHAHLRDLRLVSVIYRGIKEPGGMGDPIIDCVWEFKGGRV
jgi:hypothetical protein